MKIVLEIKDIDKAKTVINFLSQNPHIKIKNIENTEKNKKSFDMDEMFGFWNKRDITGEKIRKKAWGY